jgi:hypothetical protein
MLSHLIQCVEKASLAQTCMSSVAVICATNALNFLWFSDRDVATFQMPAEFLRVSWSFGGSRMQSGVDCI